jgi:hypothetical protein
MAAVYQVTVYQYGKQYRVTARWDDDKAARKGAARYFRGRTKVVKVEMVSQIPKDH